VISHETAEFQHPAGYRVPSQLNLDLAVVVLEIAIGGSSAKVDPFSDYGVAEKAFMPLIGISLEDRTFDLATQSALGSKRALTELSSIDHSSISYVAGSRNGGKSTDSYIFPNVHGSFKVQYGESLYPRILADKESSLVTVHLDRGVDEAQDLWPQKGEVMRE